MGVFKAGFMPNTIAKLLQNIEHESDFNHRKLYNFKSIFQQKLL